MVKAVNPTFKDALKSPDDQDASKDSATLRAGLLSASRAVDKLASADLAVAAGTPTRRNPSAARR
jgi:hypothetical protein